MPTDAELMERVRAGELAAFELLVSRYERRLLQLFYRWAGDRGLAEDCAQEVFVKLYRSRSRYRPEASFRTFLYRIATNHWIDVYRYRRARPAMGRLDGALAGVDRGTLTLVDVLPSPEPGPVEEAEGHELAERIARSVRRLSPEHRDVWYLAQEQGLKYGEVSAILGIPVGTVKSRMHAAVDTLRRWLREEIDRAGIDDGEARRTEG